MGDLRKPQFSKKRRFFPRPLPIGRMAFGGTFVLILWFVVITSIPPAHGASSLFLPLIMKPPICDPAMTLTSGDTQVLFGTPGDDHICEYGFGGNITQYAEGSAGNDSIYQDCRGVITCDQTAILGDGTDIVWQYGSEGNDTQYAAGGTGDQSFYQYGGSGDDVMELIGDIGSYIFNQIGGLGNDTIKVTGGSGNDTIDINAGYGNDTITYNVTAGTDMVDIDGGPGDDRLTVNKNQQNVTILSDTGTIICKSGDGGTTITVVNVEHITLNGDAGNPICQYDAPPSPPTVPTPPPDSQFDKTFIFPRADGDLDQFQIGTPGKDKIEQYGGTGNTTQYAEGSADNDWILQAGGDLRTDQTAIAGSGDDKIYQYGGNSDNAQFIEVGTGNKILIQVGGDGNNIMEIIGGDGSATIEQYGGKGDNTMTIEGSTGDDTIKMLLITPLY